MTPTRDNNREKSFKEAFRQFVEAQLFGREPDIEELVKNYPEFEDRIRQKLEKFHKVDSLFGSIIRADESDFDDPAPGHDLVGRKVGNFQIVEMIGRGGMGVVYLAHDTKLKRSVALKSIPAALAADLTARKRFRREAELLASLNHPNIAVIHDILEEDKSGYLILEYVPGETLADRIIRQPLTLEQALSIGRQVAEAISAAHDKGIVHRDLKPGNIKITPDGRVKVLDFGLAKVPSGEGKSGDITETQPNRMIGTPAYMSPEQIRGGPIDRRTDIWSFGCLLYQMLTGKRPFEGGTVSDTVARIIEREPDWQALPQETPANIRTLLRRCLEKDPHHRLQHIGDAALEISETLHPPTIARPTILHTKLRKMVMLVGAVCIIVLSSVAVWFALTKQPQPSSKEIRLVVLPFENLGPPEDEWFADGMTDEITGRLAGIHGLAVISRQSAIHYKNKETSTSQIAQELRVDYILEGTIQREKPSDPNSRVRIRPQLIRASDDIEVWRQNFDSDMREVFRLQSEVAEEVAQALDITLRKSERKALAYRPTENKKAYEYYLSGKEYYNQHEYRRAIELLEKAVQLDSKFALAHAQLSRTHISLYWTDPNSKTQACLDMAWEAVDKAKKINPNLPEVHLALGHYYYHGHREYEDALDEFDIVLRAQPNNDEALAFTCYVQRKQGKVEEALANIIKASEINPVNRTWAMDIPELLIYLKRYSEALESCDRAIRLYPGYAHPHRVKAWVCLYRDGNTNEARKVLQEASNIIESPETEYVDILTVLDVFDEKYDEALNRLFLSQDFKGPFLPKIFRIALIYEYKRDKKSAIKYYEEARKIYESKPQEGLEDFNRHGLLGMAYAGLGLEKEAIQKAEILEKFRRSVKRDAFYNSEVIILSFIYLLLGDHDKAIDQLEILLLEGSQLSVPFVKNDPTWEPLHNHPRFQKLIQSAN